MESWHSPKIKYLASDTTIESNGWSVKLFAVEVGTRGYCSKSLLCCLKKLSFNTTLIKNNIKKLSKSSMECSFCIWPKTTKNGLLLLSLKSKTLWRKPAIHHFLAHNWNRTTIQSLAVKLNNTHKPAKSPTNNPNYPPTSQTSQIPNKSLTNQPKTALLFPWRHFSWTTTFFLAIPWEKRNRCIILMLLLDFAFPLPSPLHSSFTSPIAGYSPSHKLLTQWRN